MKTYTKAQIQKFWLTVESLDWGRNPDYDSARAKIVEQVSRRDARAMEEMFEEYHTKLCRSLTGWEQKTGRNLILSDDSFDDFVSHIIGLGQRSYDEALEEPERYVKMAHDRSFVESFRYVWPSGRDYGE